LLDFPYYERKISLIGSLVLNVAAVKSSNRDVA